MNNENTIPMARKACSFSLVWWLLLPTLGASAMASPVVIPEKLVDPEAHGGLTCTTAVRTSVQGCDTWGLLPEDILEVFPINQLEVCRAECAECCDTLPQFGDNVGFLQGLNDMCACAGLVYVGLPGLVICLGVAANSYPDVVASLLGIGFLDGNGIDGSGPLFEWPWESTQDGDIQSIHGPSWGPPRWWSNLSWRAQAAFLSGFYLACDTGTSVLISEGVELCHKDCAASFPLGDPPQPPVGGEGGGGNENGGGDGPDGPDGPDDGDGENPFETMCQEMQGDPCYVDGKEGTMDDECRCAVVWTDFGECPSEYEDICQENSSNCWICNHDQDPPPWCDTECWGYGD